MQLPPTNSNALSTHKFGIITITSQLFQSQLLQSTPIFITPIFLGKTSHKKFKLNQQINYPIMTTLWHFYLYLTDMESIKFILHMKQNQMNEYNSQMMLQTLEPRIVLNSNFISNKLLKKDCSICEIKNQQGQKVGTFKISLKLQFNLQLHSKIKNLVNFGETFVIHDISRIKQDHDIIQVPRIPPVHLNTQNKKNVQNKIFSQKNIKQQQVCSPQDQKMINDDIDRMIAQMQSKPYDSSRYSEQKQSSTPKKIQHNLFTQSNQFKQTDIFKQSHHMPPLHKTISNFQPTPFHSRQNFSMVRSSSQQKLANKQTKQLKLTIHELLITGDNSEKYQLSMLINQDESQQCKLKGKNDGDLVVYNYQTRIMKQQQINTLKFYLKHQNCQISCGIFDMKRLEVIPNKKGVFMIPILFKPKNDLTMSNKSLKLKKIQTPTYRTLKIQLQAIDKQRIVQIYIYLNGVSVNFTSIKYKIPYTKQSIEFSEKKHINIFPHIKTYEQLTFQFWNQKKLLGIAEVCLKKMKNVNFQALNSSLQPIYLYEGEKSIISILNKQRIGKFNLLLCYGNVKQVQKMLLNTPEPQTKQRIKTEVQLNEKLGIFIKQKKKNTSIEIQVNMDEQIFVNNVKQFGTSFSENSLNQFLNESIINKTIDFQQNYKSSQCQNQFLDKSQQLNHQTYQQTMPNFKKIIPSVQQSPQKNSQSISLKQSQHSQQTKKYKSVTQTISNFIKQQLKYLLEPTILSQLKQLLKKHIIYNFVDKPILQQSLRTIGIQEKVNIIISNEILGNNDMVNVNILYDYIVCLQLNGHIKANLISDTLLGRFALKLIYEFDGQSQIDQQTQWSELKQIMLKMNYKLTMHEYNAIISFVNSLIQDKICLKKYKQSVIGIIEKQKIIEQQQKLQQQEVLQALYGNNCNNSLLSTHKNISMHNKTQQFNETIKKQDLSISFNKNTQQNLFIEQCSILKIEGLQTCKQSASYLLNISTQKSYIKIKIYNKSYIIKNDEQLALNGIYDDIEGQILLCLQNSDIIGKAIFSIIEGVKSVYPLKNQQQFCGLINLTLQKP